MKKPPAASRLRCRRGPAVAIARLRSVVRSAGRIGGNAEPLFHYVVETDVLPEHEADFNRWYDRRAPAGLAAVPGTDPGDAASGITSASPRYHACYDVASPSTVGSRAWARCAKRPGAGR